MQEPWKRRPPVFVLGTVMFLALLPSFSLPAALPLIAAEWGMGPAQSGIVMAAFQAGYIVAALVALPLTDRFDTRYVIAGGSGLTAAGHLLFPILSTDPVTGIILRAVAGAGLGCIYMPGIRLVSEVTVTMRGRAVGGYVFSYLMGTAASFALTGMLLGFFEWRTAYLFVALAGALAFPLALFVICHPALERGAPANPFVTLSPSRKRFHRESVRLHLPVMLLIGAYVVHMWELYGLRSWMSPFLADALGQTGMAAVSLAATLTAFSVVLSGVSALVAGWLSDRMGRVATASVIMAVSAACSLTFGWLFNAPLWSLLLVGLVLSLTVASDSPVFSAGITEMSDPRILGRVMAWQTFLGYGAATVSPAVMGYIMERSADEALGWGLAFSSLGLVALTGPLFLMYLRRLPESRRLCGGRG
ncbi:MAG: MFS transporter [Bacillota bacterium]